MAYTNHTENLLTGLRTILGTEFGSKPVIVWGEQDKRPGREYFELRLLRTEPADSGASRRGRLYSVGIAHICKISAVPEFKKLVVSGELIERVEDLLYDNRAYSVSGSYYWHELEFGECDYLAATEKDETDGFSRAELVIKAHIDKLTK